MSTNDVSTEESVRLRSLVDSVLDCHAGDPGSIPGRVGDFLRSGTWCCVVIIIIIIIIDTQVAEVASAKKTCTRQAEHDSSWGLTARNATRSSSSSLILHTTTLLWN